MYSLVEMEKETQRRSAKGILIIYYYIKVYFIILSAYFDFYFPSQRNHCFRTPIRIAIEIEPIGMLWQRAKVYCNTYI